jgi:hypothetical protein
VDSFVANDTRLGDFEKSSSTAAVASSTTATGDQQLGDTITDVGSNSEEAFQNNQVMILSGANSSGKSVYLKQVSNLNCKYPLGLVSHREQITDFTSF